MKKISLSDKEEKIVIGNLIGLIKQLAIEVSRSEPTEWNKLMDVVLMQ
jgi:hypothetical protein